VARPVRSALTERRSPLPTLCVGRCSRGAPAGPTPLPASGPSAASPLLSPVDATARRGSPLSTDATTETSSAPSPDSADSPVENGFAALGALPETVEALAKMGITTPFAIQTMTLPIALSGHDLIGQARTGTGKTLGFGVPLLQRVKSKAEGSNGVPQALVVVPTRELAVQVAKDLENAGSVRSIRVVTIYGGRAFEPQVETLKKGVDVVVGTPGRLLDLARQGHLNLNQVSVLVLDEADEMLDLGFLPDVERILEQIHGERQTMLFSATMPGPVVAMARRFMTQPTHIRAEEPDENRTVPNTKIFVYRAHSMDKGEILARILQSEGRGLTMVFCRTKRTCDKVAADMVDRGFAAAAVHGDLGQGAREQALRAFRSGKIDVLVATDVAARGIDVQDVTHVVNYQCPEDEKVFLHRIGRTGRAGANGVAVTFVDWDDMPKWGLINKALDLTFPEPVETYSSSPHLFSDLSIPVGTKGTLPRSARVRAGLEAEHVEDLGETGRRRPAAGGRDGGRDGGRSGGRDGSRSGGRSGGRDAAPAEAAADDAPVLPKRTSSTRRRTRGGGAAAEAVAGSGPAPAGRADAPEGGADEAGGAPRRRRRGGRGRGRGTGEGSTSGEQAGAAE
jgi:superfamily II DNA/RNA helicase